jgi:hypothetical protein
MPNFHFCRSTNSETGTLSHLGIITSRSNREAQIAAIWIHSPCYPVKRRPSDALDSMLCTTACAMTEETEPDPNDFTAGALHYMCCAAPEHASEFRRAFSQHGIRVIYTSDLDFKEGESARISPEVGPQLKVIFLGIIYLTPS